MAAARKKPVLKVEAPEVVKSHIPASAPVMPIKAGFNKNLKAYQTTNVRTGIKVKIPTGYVGLIVSDQAPMVVGESGNHHWKEQDNIAVLKGVTVANSPMVITPADSGEIVVPLHNSSQFQQNIKFGDKIAELILVPYVQPEIVEVEDLKAKPAPKAPAKTE